MAGKLTDLAGNKSLEKCTWSEQYLRLLQGRKQQTPYLDQELPTPPIGDALSHLAAPSPDPESDVLSAGERRVGERGNLIPNRQSPVKPGRKAWRAVVGGRPTNKEALVLHVSQIPLSSFHFQDNQLPSWPLLQAKSTFFVAFCATN
ncbi:hypothetical protein RND71_014844 [Anisodus tanguticus]|uniref:Uncharacterized protein n=1 Tax=Anisodus tanguticus TaxID=243964 RepID=A0AAE1SCE0_9SOLA|nr:hypothetical protein RND71_014844 [Anisodus tanguticus]